MALGPLRVVLLEAGPLALALGCAQPGAPQPGPTCTGAVYVEPSVPNRCSIWMFEARREETPHWVNPISGAYDVVGWPIGRRGLPWERHVFIAEDAIAVNAAPAPGAPAIAPVWYRLRILEHTPTEVIARATRHGDSRRIRFELGRAGGGTHRVVRVTGLLDGPGALELRGDRYGFVDCEPSRDVAQPLAPLGGGGFSR